MTSVHCSLLNKLLYENCKKNIRNYKKMYREVGPPEGEFRVPWAPTSPMLPASMSPGDTPIICRPDTPRSGK